jgi:hypothetical protein
MAVIQMPAVAAVRASVGRRATVTGATVARFQIVGPAIVTVHLVGYSTASPLLRVSKMIRGLDRVMAEFPPDEVPANLVADFAVNLSRKAVR